MIEVRTCKKCSETKPLEQFKRNKKAKTGYLYTCKACDILDSIRYRTDHPERVKATQAAYSARKKAARLAAAALVPPPTAEEIAAKLSAQKQRRRAWDRARYVRNHPPSTPQPPIPPAPEATCTHCNTTKPIEEFVKCTSIQRGYRLICKPCNRLRSKQFDEQHGEERRQYRQKQGFAYRKAHPEKIRENGHRRKARKANAPVNDLTARQWKEIQQSYGFRCAYCGKQPKLLTPDHITPYFHNGSNTLWNVVPACLECNMKKKTGPPLTPVQPLLLTIAKPRTSLTIPTDPAAQPQ